jgi:ferric-dicitrate binding protein FerR (iron transport regulator)
MSERWTDHSLDEAFRGVREDIKEDREEARDEHAEISRRVEAVSQQCRHEHAAVMTRLEKQDSARDAARLESRKAILAFAGVLLAAVIAAGGAIVVALLAGGPA